MLHKLLIDHGIGSLIFRQCFFKMHHEYVRIDGFTHTESYDLTFLAQYTSDQAKFVFHLESSIQHLQFDSHIIVPFIFPGKYPAAAERFAFLQVVVCQRLVAPFSGIFETRDMVSFVVHFTAAECGQLFPVVDVIFIIPVFFDQKLAGIPGKKLCSGVFADRIHDQSLSFGTIFCNQLVKNGFFVAVPDGKGVDPAVPLHHIIPGILSAEAVAYNTAIMSLRDLDMIFDAPEHIDAEAVFAAVPSVLLQKLLHPVFVF